MKRLSVQGARPLKILHLACISLWIGGLAAWLPLVFGAGLQSADAAHTTYLHLRAIAWNVVGWGGIGSFLSGLALAGLTTWNLFTRRWIVAKLLTTVSAVLIGMFFIERHMLAGLAMLENRSQLTANFTDNHRLVQIGVVGQLSFFVAIIAIAVLKPGDAGSTSAQ